MANQNQSKPTIYYALGTEQFSIPQLIESGVAAEQAGFDGVWASDHFQPWQPNEGHGGSAWVLLSALTQRTSRIQLGTGVTCPILRYRPAVVAQVWATLSQLAPKRVFLGLGLGEKLNEGAAGGGWTTYQERSAMAEEAIKIIRALWTGQPVQMKGDFWHVEGKLYDPPVAAIPIYIAASAPKSARFAGLNGDGLITGSDVLPKIKEPWEKAVHERGQTPHTQKVIVEHWVFVGNREDAKEGVNKWRFLSKAWTHGYYDNISPAEIQANAEREIDLETAMNSWTIGTDPQLFIDTFRNLTALGATDIALHCSGSNQLETIKFLGREVLPSLRSTKLVVA